MKVQCFGMKYLVKVGTIKLLHDFQGLHLKRRYFEHKSYNKHSQTWMLMFFTTKRTFFQTLSPWNLILSKNFKNKFPTLEKFTTLWRNVFHTSHSLGKTITLFATLQTQSLCSKGLSFSMLYKLNLWLLLVLIQCPFSCLVWAHNLLETTWKQARNETLKLHEMKQLY
jgi:hypothetical protein